MQRDIYGKSKEETLYGTNLVIDGGMTRKMLYEH